MGYGSNLVLNGTFDSDTVSWAPGTGATLTNEANGQDGNCMMVTCDGTDNRYGEQLIVVSSGILYDFSIYFKKGNADHGRILVGITADSSDYYDSGDISDAGWTKYSTSFLTTDTNCYITLYSREALNTAYYDTVVLRSMFSGGGEARIFLYQGMT